MNKFLKHLKTALLVSASMFIICGFIYPMVMTAIAQVVFPKQANGSLIEENGKVVGSSLVGQDFTDERLFHCRPSTYKYNTYTKEDKENGDYSTLASGSENYASSNPELKKRIEADIEEFLKENPTISKEEIPADIVTASGSGLDPHISVEAAKVQVDRVCQNTGLTKEVVEKMIEDNTEDKLLGIFGEETVNVLELNLTIAKEINMI